jgi:hypothetical protein
MLGAYSNTKWTSTRVAPTRNAPFAGLGAEPTPVAKEQQGVVLVLLGLGLIAVLNGIRQGSASRL